MTISHTNLSIINIQESKLSHKDPEHMYTIDSYHAFRHDRDLTNFNENGGGGLLSYVNKKWSHNKPKVIMKVSNPNIELLAIVCRPKFLPSKYKCVINVNLYCRPQRNKRETEKELSKCLKFINKTYPRAYLIICGDANQAKIEVLDHFSLTNLIQVATFYPNKSILDVAYTSEQNVYKCEMSAPLGKAETSFHLSYYLIPSDKSRNKWNIRKSTTITDIDALNHALNTTDWDFIPQGDLDEMVDTCDSYIEYLIQCFSRQIKTEPQDIFSRLKHEDHLKKLNKAKYKAIQTGDKGARNKIQKEIIIHVKKIRENILKQMNSKDLFQMIKNLTKDSTINKLPTLREASDMNNFFTRFNSEKCKDDDRIKGCHTNPSIHIAENEVISLFKEINSGTSSGPSRIPAWFFKKCGDSVSNIYSQIYTKSFLLMQYPTCWKYAYITPVPKKPNVLFSDHKSYRPIAVTPIQARILDKIALKRINNAMSHLEDVCQFAYKNNFSTIDALLYTIESIASGIDRNPGVVMKSLFIDYSSAFNTVLQNQLANLIYQSDSNLGMWLNSYMSNWRQSIKTCTREVSEPLQVEVGIPQGGPLSAKLFTYCTDNINNTSLHIHENNGNIAKYSDDTRLIYAIQKSVNYDQQQYQNLVNEIYYLSNEKNLKLNAAKCEEMSFTNIKNYPKVDLTINGNSIPNVHKVKYLGLTITDKLDWTLHINNIMQKCFYITKCLIPILPYIQKATKIQLFKSLVLSNILYAAEVWGCNLQTSNRKKLLKILKFYSYVSNIEKSVLIDIVNKSFYDRFTHCIEKIRNNPMHPLHNKLNNANNAYDTRHNFTTSYCRTTMYQNTFIPCASLYLTRQYNPRLI